MNQHNYWLTTAHLPGEENTITPLPEKVDVAILGGGYTGLSAARTLAKHGVQTVVLEAEHIGWGASSRNGGMVLTGLKLPMQTVLRRYGRELARRLFQCSLEAVNLVEAIVREEQMDCGFARTGHLQTANKPQHDEMLKREAECLAKEFGHQVRLVAPRDLKEEIGSAIYYGGLVDEASAGLNPAQYVAGLARAAEQAGARLHAQARVTRLERRGTRFVLHTPRGILNAQSVLAATAGYTGSVTQRLQRKIIPIGSFIIATEPLPAGLAHELSPKNRMIFDSRHYLNYFRLWENRLIFGGRAAFFPANAKTVQRSAEILRSEMIRVYPQLKDVKVEYVWGGTLDFAFDTMTHVGEEAGVYYSLGYAGHGVGMGTYLGKTVAEAMLKENIREHPFAQFKFPSAPLGLYNGFPWFLPLAGAWYRFWDWIE